MTAKHYCTSCSQYVESEVRIESETQDIRGDAITLRCKIRYCLSCSEQMWDSELEKQTMIAFYDEYKKRHQLLTSNEIRSLRDCYGLSQSAFAKILGAGEKTITRYENGAIQDEAINNLLLLIKNRDNFLILWEKNRILLTEAEVLRSESLLSLHGPVEEVSSWVSVEKNGLSLSGARGKIIHFPDRTDSYPATVFKSFTQ